MKLTRKNLIELIRLKNEGKTSYYVKKKVGISVRRIDQIWKKYNLIGKAPELGISFGKPKRKIKRDEMEAVKESYKKYRICASRLQNKIQKDYKIYISVYTIHNILLELGFAKPNGRDDVRKKKWIRYERRYSLTAVHLDWYFDKNNGLWALPIIDDASRKLLALIEVESPTTDASIDAMDEALKHGEIQQCITDHGTQFIKGEDDKARFPAFLKKKGIKHILCRIKHPQSNGKSEKFNDLYKNHRHAFKTKEEFIHWYNEIRPHMSLDEKTPEEAYQSKKKKERVYYT
jgi:putative transposase